MTQDYSIQHSDKTVFATCIKTRATCPLTRLFAPLPNIRVLCDQKQNNLFRCSIILRGTPAEIQAAMPTALDITRQACQQCKNRRFVTKIKTR